MNKPLTSWKNALSILGRRVNWDAVYRLKRTQPVEPNVHSLRLEVLESRQMLSTVTGGEVPEVTFDEDAGVLTVVGTLETDTIVVKSDGDEVSVRHNFGTSSPTDEDDPIFTIDASSVEEIVIFGGDGRDTLDGSKIIDIPLLLFGGSGNDSLAGGSDDDTIVTVESATTESMAETITTRFLETSDWTSSTVMLAMTLSMGD